MLIDKLLRPLLAVGTAVILVTAIFVSVVAQDVSTEIREALDAGDTASAISMLETEIKADESYHMNYYALGRIYLERGNYSAASEQFKLALKRKKKHFESQYYLAICDIELGNLDAAEKVMKEGQKKSKDHADWFANGYGLVMLKREKYQEADKSFRMALATNEEAEAKALKDLKSSPYSEEDRARLAESIKKTARRERAEYHLNLGDANFFSGVPSLAIMEYEKALKVDSGSLDVYFHWAEACLSTRDYPCALGKLQVVLSRDSTHAQAWQKIAEIYFKAARAQRTRSDRVARFKDAIGAYLKYVDLTQVRPDSANVRVFFELAMSYAEINGFEEAAANFEKVLAIPFEIRDIYYNYGKALWGLKKFRKASDALLKHIDWVAKQDEKYKSNIQDVELYRLLGDSYFYRKPHAYLTAIDYYKKSLEQSPDQKRLLQNIAIGYHSTRNYIQALEYYDRRIALGIDSNRVSLLRNAGFCAMNIAGGDADDDEFSLDDEDEEEDGESGEIVDQNAPQPDPNVNYFELAISYLSKYLDAVPTDEKVLQAVANTYLYQLADCANGVAGFEKLLAIDPQNCAANKAIGFAYFGGEICRTDYTKALGYLKKAYNCIAAGEGACSDIDISLWIAQCYHLRAAARQQNDKVAASKDFKNAFDWYGKVLKCEPGNSDAKKGQDDTRFEFN